MEREVQSCGEQRSDCSEIKLCCGKPNKTRILLSFMTKGLLKLNCVSKVLPLD